MGKAVKGIVMEITKDSAVLMTGSGEFVKVKKPSSRISTGDEIIARTANYGFKIKYAAAAAVIMLMLIPFVYLRQAMATVAYVNVDINPSLEMGINKYNKVSDVKPFNDDARKITESLSLKGMEIDDALSMVIETAADMGYMDDNKDNTIQIALINLDSGNININEETLIKCAQSAAEQLNIDTKIKVNSAGRKEHKEADEKNMSTNKYLDETENIPVIETHVKKQTINENNQESNSKQDKENKQDNNQNKDEKQIEDKKAAPMPEKNNTGEQNKEDKEVQSPDENGNKQNEKNQSPKENANQNGSSKDKAENGHKDGGSSNQQKDKK